MLIKQPNGLFCFCDERNRYTSIINLSKDEYIKHVLEQTKEKIERQFDENKFDSIRFLIENRILTDEQLKSMGYEKSCDEMIKYIPKHVKNKRYVSVDFATYGDCPSCGCRVQDGIGRTDKECPKCRQILLWSGF